MKTWERLKKEREKRGWSQSQMAEKLHMSQQKYHPYEHGREMKSSMIISVCTVLKCSPNWLLGISEEGARLTEDSLLLHQLREAFDQLNEVGQQKVTEYAQILSKLPEYTGQVKNGGGADVKEVAQ